MNEILRPVGIEYMSSDIDSNTFYLVKLYGKLSCKIFRAYYSHDELIEIIDKDTLNNLINKYEEGRKEK